MSRKKEKKLKKLKQKKIWPSLVVFIFTAFLTSILVPSIISVLFSYIIESKFISSYENTKLISQNISIDIDNVMDLNDALNKIDYESYNFNSIFLIDNNNECVAGRKLPSIDFHTKTKTLLDETLEYYISKEDHIFHRLYIESEDFSFFNVYKFIFTNAHEVFQYENNLNSLYRRCQIYLSIPCCDGKYSLILGKKIDIHKFDILILVSIFAILIIVIIIPLVFMFINVLGNVKVNKRFRDLLFLDTITGGKNWNYFLERSKKILSKKPKNNTYAIVDLEFMKYRTFCSCCGIKEGEKLLEEIYITINNMLSKKELCTRYARANFSILLCSTSVDENIFKDKLEKILNTINEITSNHRTIYHIGYCVVDYSKLDRKNIDITNLYNCAAAARASVLDGETSAIIKFEDSLLETQQWEHHVEDTMEKAIENKEFQVYYQPKYNPATNELSGAEALIRWKSGDGLIPPGKFIPIFEKNGFITKIDDYMLSNVAKQQAAWLAEGKAIVPVSVNVSRAHFAQDDLAEHILALVDEHKLPHKYIEIELTESAFFDDKNILLTTVNKLKSYGFEISMDDFGAGYSSLNSLKDLPLDVLKLDAEFFRGDVSDERARIVVSEAITLAKQLNMRIVAEGIENKEHVDFLADIGCDMIQGYYFAKPMPADDYEYRIVKKTAIFE